MNEADRHIPWAVAAPIVRSKFNVALGIEAQGFCVLKSRE
jgi:hypothetical protein